MTEQELAEIEKRWSKVTPGKWFQVGSITVRFAERPNTDMLAIAAAPEDVRDLIAEVRRLNAEVEGLKSAVHEPGAPELSAPEAKEFKTFVAKLKHIGDMLPSTFTSKD